MKRTLFILLISGQCFAQQPDTVNGRIMFTEVVSVDSASADELYGRAKLAVANMYSSSKAVTDLADEKQHTIIVKAYTDAYHKSMQFGGFNYVMKLYCKDNRYKYELTDISHTTMYDIPDRKAASGGAFENIKPDCGGFFMTKGQWAIIKQDGVKKFQAIVARLKIEMASKSMAEKSEW